MAKASPPFWLQVSLMPHSRCCSIISKMLDGIEVRGLCRPIKFFLTKLRKQGSLCRGGKSCRTALSNCCKDGSTLLAGVSKNSTKSTQKCAANMKNTVALIQLTYSLLQSGHSLFGNLD